MNFCPKCGQPIDQSTGLCPVCGDVSAPALRGPSYGRGFTAALKERIGSPLFLWFCILYTLLTFVAVGILGASFVAVKEMSPESLISFIITSIFSMSFTVIMLIAFWRIYFAARSPENDMKLGGLKTLSVIITIERVLLWILIGVFALVTVLAFAAPSFITATDAFGEVEDIDFFIYFYGAVMVFVLILMILLNIFYYGSIKKSIVSIIDSFKADENRLRKLGAVKVWHIVLGILSALSLLNIGTVYAMFKNPAFTAEMPAEYEYYFTSYGSLLIIGLIVFAVCIVATIALYFIGAAMAGKVNIPKEPESPQNYVYTQVN